MKRAIFIVLVLFGYCASAQTLLEYNGRPRYPGGLLSLKAGTGYTKYLGEFTDGLVGNHYAFGADFAILPEFSLGLGADAGSVQYDRRWRRMLGNVYEYQFGQENYVRRSTWFSTFTLEGRLHFFPRQAVDGYFLVGGGVTFFNPDDYAQERVAARPLSDYLGSVTIPVGLGADVFLTRSLAINAEWRLNFMFSDDFDAFNTNLIRSQALNQNMEDLAVTDESSDSYSVLTFGIKYFLFEDGDMDGDLIPNTEEESLGSNPYDADTDGEGLSDYEEIRVFHSNPLLKDSDRDGLNDYVEAVKYRTSPLEPDTDGDGVTDAEEIQTHKSDALAADTDGDGLNDAEELIAKTSLREIDTDHDNLDDLSELRKHATDPLVPDSDGDGLTDYDEVVTYHTAALKPDTDGDGLTDYDEVATARTNPLLTDTDGDGLSDGEEARVTATNPISRDTDGDGYPDNVDRCPLLAETFNGSDDADGCPDGASGGGFAETQRLPVQNVRQSGVMLRIDTLVIREGGLLTLFGVNFEPDRDVIRPESFPILEENARLFEAYPDLTVEIRGHTDSDGSDEHNADLSLRRAKAVQRVMQEHGVRAERLTVAGLGESRPVASNTTAFGKARNRRIEFYIVKRGESKAVDTRLLTGEPRLFEEAPDIPKEK